MAKKKQSDIVIPNLETNEKPNDEVIIEPEGQTPPPPPPLQPQKKQPNTKHKGAFIASIICVVVSIVFTALSYYVLGSFLIKQGQTNSQLEAAIGLMAFVLYMFTFGLVTFVPALGTAIASLCTSIRCWSSSVKTFKAFGIVIFIISLLLLLALIAIVVLFMLPSVLVGMYNIN